MMKWQKQNSGLGSMRLGCSPSRNGNTSRRLQRAHVNDLPGAGSKDQVCGLSRWVKVDLRSLVRSLPHGDRGILYEASHAPVEPLAFLPLETVPSGHHIV